MALKELTEEFLAQKRIAVVGVSRSKQDAANLIYRKLRDVGYEVFAVNPNAEQVEGDVCYSSVGAIPGGVTGVVIVTRPEITETVVADCAESGVSYVWIHNNPFARGHSSVSARAVQICLENGIKVIPGVCPLMYCQPVDFGHKCMRWLLDIAGKSPKGN